MGQLNELVHEAMLRCGPDQAAGIEQAALDARGVWFDHRASTATTDVTARLDTLDALDLQATVGDLAGLLGRFGDDRPLDVRQATALGLLAHPQRALDLVTGDADPAALNGSRGTLFLHVDAAALETGTGGRVETLGPATLGLLRDWISRFSSVAIRPVLDLNRGDEVGHHDPPNWMRETVILRDAHCVFPGCGIDARGCDLDHIDPYVPPDDGSPPGQTRPANLAALCRRHHRLKTFTAWTYQRRPDGDYAWTDPHGTTYLVTPG
ncbi:MAG: HNH endonuclease signature motif containing protein [Nocardioidaceae bacterium]